MRDLGSRAFSVWVRVPSGAPKRERHDAGRVVLFLRPGGIASRRQSGIPRLVNFRYGISARSVCVRSDSVPAAPPDSGKTGFNHSFYMGAVSALLYFFEKSAPFRGAAAPAAALLCRAITLQLHASYFFFLYIIIHLNRGFLIQIIPVLLQLNYKQYQLIDLRITLCYIASCGTEYRTVHPA